MAHQGRVSSGDEAPPDGPDADPEAVARSIALARLAAAPRTRAELAQTMAKRGVPQDVAARVLDRFEEVGLVDDAAFATAWVQSRQAGRGLARRALAGELHRRGVEPATAGAALDEIPPEAELAAARRLVDRKLRSSTGLDRAVRMRRLVGMLARKGYPSGVAIRVVKEALDGDPTPVGGAAVHD
jgi:regulatory protein